MEVTSAPHNHFDWMMVCLIQKLKSWLFSSVIFTFGVKLLMLNQRFEKQKFFMCIIHMKKIHSGCKSLYSYFLALMSLLLIV